MIKGNVLGKGSKIRRGPKSSVAPVAGAVTSRPPVAVTPVGLKILKLYRYFVGTTAVSAARTNKYKGKRRLYSCEIGRQVPRGTHFFDISDLTRAPKAEGQVNALEAYKAARAAVSARSTEPRNARRRVLATAEDFLTITPKMQEEREAAARKRFDVIDHAIVKL